MRGASQKRKKIKSKHVVRSMCEPCVDGLDLETEWNSLDGLVCVNTIRTDTVAEKGVVSKIGRV